MTPLTKQLEAAMASERWANISGYPKYMVSDYGRVMSCCVNSRFFSPMKPMVNHGYHRVMLTNENGPKYFRVHRLVLAAFVGPSPTGRHVCSHLDDVKTNNHYKNLVWATNKENTQQAVKNKRMHFGENHPGAILSDKDAIYIRTHYQRNDDRTRNSRELAKRFGVSKNTITAVVRSRTFKHLPDRDKIRAQLKGEV